MLRRRAVSRRWQRLRLAVEMTLAYRGRFPRRKLFSVYWRIVNR
jgi:hypothetical protein